VLIAALGKLSMQSSKQLPPDAAALVESLTKSESVELQQRALEVQALLR
jgi:hypothetical protein